MKKIFIGIDISSKTLDLCIKKGDKVVYIVIDNEIKAIKKYFKQYSSDNIIIAMENTGRYNWNLYEVLAQFSFKVYVISPLHLKRSLGLVRGKNDKIDALRICNFIEKNEAESTLWKPTKDSIKQLKILITERKSRLKMKMTLLKQQHDFKLMKSIGLDKELTKLNVDLVKSIDKQIEILQLKIENLLEFDLELKKQAELIRSVPGVGKVLSWLLISKTEGFSTINEARKMACYAGVVPFENQSGTSYYRKPKVSVFADKSLKSVLHMAAMSAIRLDNDLGTYYKRKVEEGKNKMSVLNAVRNKIIHRVFAVMKNQLPYQKNAPHMELV